MKLTQQQYDSLVNKIYATLMQSDEMDMGEMPMCEETAKNIVDEWMDENNISVE